MVEGAVRQIIERALAGDDAAAREVRRRLRDGDAQAMTEVGQRIARGEKDVARLLAGEDADSDVDMDADPDTFQAELRRAADLTTSQPATTGKLMADLARKARLLGPCERVLVSGLEAMRQTLLADLDRSAEALATAKAGVQGCQACELENLRREALLLLHLGQGETALATSQRAMDGYQMLGAPGHDLNGDGWASSLIVRAQIRSHLGDDAGAAADFATALPRFPSSSKVWKVTHQNLAATLAQTGPQGRRAADEALATIRLSMRRGVSVERAYFLWLDGQLWLALGKRRDRGLNRLRRSLRLFAKPEIRTPVPALGVAADISKALYPNREEIAEFIQRELKPLGKLFADAHHREQLREIYALCRQCPSMRTWPALRRAVERLREGIDELPCLLEWRGFNRLVG